MLIFKSAWSLHICSLYNALNQHAYKLYILLKGVKFQWRGMIGEGAFWHNIYFLKSHTCIKKGKKLSCSQPPPPNPPTNSGRIKKNNAKEGNLHNKILNNNWSNWCTCMYHAPPPPPTDIRIFIVSRIAIWFFWGGCHDFLDQSTPFKTMQRACVWMRTHFYYIHAHKLSISRKKKLSISRQKNFIIKCTCMKEKEEFFV